MLVINILIAAFSLTATLAAFGGDTWDKDEPVITKRINLRGWVSLLSIVIAFSLGVYKEIHTHHESIKKDNASEILRSELKSSRDQIQESAKKIATLESSLSARQSEINAQVMVIENLQKELQRQQQDLADKTDSLSIETNSLARKQLSSIESAFRLAIATVPEVDNWVLNLNGSRLQRIPSRKYDQMQLHWGDSFKFVMFPSDYSTSDLSTLKLVAGDNKYPLHSGNGNSFFEETIRVYGSTPKAMPAYVENPMGLTGVKIKIFVRSSDSTRGQKEFKKLVTSSEFFSIAKDIYKTTTAGLLRLRSEASTQSQILSQLPKGSFVRVVQNVGSWSEIVTPEGRQGWVASKFLAIIE
ncbi:SH3 domain-containing protein [Pseudoalteromonas sp. T1lg24]|uniref:SH3 domain-containing protein n=1 Tax=Pseudoalteromonas sp. T1lg24 TaxID=2077099 RepID=UPI000CF72030|nr:SH3 domain-containing protein [Pseudoalteromonas sp. T1lg24]